MLWQTNRIKSNPAHADTIEEAVGRNLIFSKLQDLVAWGRKNSIWPFNFGRSEP